MSNYNTQSHPYRYEQEFNEILDLDYTHFDVCSHGSLPRKLEEQWLPDTVFDPFDMANWPTIDWEDFEHELTNPPLETPKDMTLHISPSNEYQDVKIARGREKQSCTKLFSNSKRTQKGSKGRFRICRPSKLHN